jgi:hypothetical protein
MIRMEQNNKIKRITISRKRNDRSLVAVKRLKKLLLLDGFCIWHVLTQ